MSDDGEHVDKRASYSTHDAAQDTIDRMTKRLSGDIRSKIRRVAPPVQQSLGVQ